MGETVKHLIGAYLVTAGNVEKLFHIGDAEIADAPVEDLARIKQRIEGVKCFFQRDLLAPVQKIQVQLIHSETPETAFARRNGAASRRIPRQHLAHQKNLITTSADCLPDQFLSAAYSLSLQRHVSLDFKETLGTTTLANGEFAYLAITGTNMFAAPANELFDNRTNYLQSRVDLTWDATSRLSFDFGGQGFVVRRESRALAGLSGYSARSDIAYRLTRHQTISASYEYARFDFQHTFADAALQIAALGYSIGFSRDWDFSMQAGTIRTEARGLNQISIAPSIAAIIGQNTAVVSFSRTLYLPIAEARLIRRLNRSQIMLSYSKSVTPGNGVYLTSRQSAGTVGYSYSGYQRVAVRLNAGYGELSSLGQTLGKYMNWQGSARMTYTLVRDTFFELEYDYRHYTTQNSGFRMDSSRMSIGLAFSPGESPLTFW